MFKPLSFLYFPPHYLVSEERDLDIIEFITNLGTVTMRQLPSWHQS